MEGAPPSRTMSAAMRFSAHAASDADKNAKSKTGSR